MSTGSLRLLALRRFVAGACLGLAVLLFVLALGACMCPENMGIFLPPAFFALGAGASGRRFVRGGGIVVFALSAFIFTQLFQARDRGTLATLPDSLMAVNGAVARATIVQAGRALGRPMSDVTDTATYPNRYLATVWQYDTVEPSALWLRFADSQLVTIQCMEKRCTLPNGIGLGATVDEVTRAMGPTRVGARQIRYKGSRGCELELRLRESRVRHVTLECSVDTLLQERARRAATGR